MKASEEVAQALLDRQMASHAQGTEGLKDIMSILSKFSYRLRWEYMLRDSKVRANRSENPKSKLRDDEILPQLT